VQRFGVGPASLSCQARCAASTSRCTSFRKRHVPAPVTRQAEAIQAEQPDGRQAARIGRAVSPGTRRHLALRAEDEMVGRLVVVGVQQEWLLVFSLPSAVARAASSASGNQLPLARLPPAAVVLLHAEIGVAVVTAGQQVLPRGGEPVVPRLEPRLGVHGGLGR